MIIDLNSLYEPDASCPPMKLRGSTVFSPVCPEGFHVTITDALDVNPSFVHGPSQLVTSGGQNWIAVQTCSLDRCGSRIWSRGGGPASEAESCRHSEAESCERSEHSAAGVQGPLKGPGSFWVFDAQICILTHSRDSFSLIFDIYFDTKS